RLHVAGDGDRVPLVVVRLTAELHEAGGGELRLDPLDVGAARWPRPQRPHEAAREVGNLHRHRNTKSKSWLMNGSRNSEITPVENTSRNNTRNPYGRNLYHCGSHVAGRIRSSSADPSRGGIGSRLNSFNSRLTTAN